MPDRDLDARRTADRALEHAGVRVGLRRPLPACRSGTPSARTCRVSRLTAHEREVAGHRGTSDFYGIAGFFEWLETKRYKIHVRVLLARYRAYTLCADCGGARLAPGRGRVRFRGQTIAELAELPLGS